MGPTQGLVALPTVSLLVPLFEALIRAMTTYLMPVKVSVAPKGSVRDPARSRLSADPAVRVR